MHIKEQLCCFETAVNLLCCYWEYINLKFSEFVIYYFLEGDVLISATVTLQLVTKYFSNQKYHKVLSISSRMVTSFGEIQKL